MPQAIRDQLLGMSRFLSYFKFRCFFNLTYVRKNKKATPVLSVYIALYDQLGD